MHTRSCNKQPDLENWVNRLRDTKKNLVAGGSLSLRYFKDNLPFLLQQHYFRDLVGAGLSPISLLRFEKRLVTQHPRAR